VAQSDTPGAPAGPNPAVGLQAFVDYAVPASVAVTNGGTSVALGATGTNLAAFIDNSSGTTDAYVAFGSSGTVAVAAIDVANGGYIVPKGHRAYLPTGGAAYFAAITSAGSCTLGLRLGTGTPLSVQ
jgi:hypothetical protein